MLRIVTRNIAVRGVMRIDRKFAEQREEMDRKFATKADLALLRSQLTTRIILSQVATAALLFVLLKLFA